MVVMRRSQPVSASETRRTLQMIDSLSTQLSYAPDSKRDLSHAYMVAESTRTVYTVSIQLDVSRCEMRLQLMQC